MDNKFYFCEIHAESSALDSYDSYLVLDEKDNEHKLTKKALLEKQDFADFNKKNKGKQIYIHYTTYKTSYKVDNSMSDEFFAELISKGNCDYVASADIDMNVKENKKKAKQAKARSGGNSSFFKTVIIGVLCVAVGSVGTFLACQKLFNSPTGTEVEEQKETKSNGMIIPQQSDISEDVDQITISIDRSYLAVPTEDLQLKGEVIDGKATITLPEFDKTDFFNHVPGYTWGFTTDPNGTKIQFHGGNTYAFEVDTKLYRVLVKYAGGSGTKSDPYLIDYYDQLELMAEESARGYFKQIDNIWFPEYAKHTSIDTVNELKDSPDAEYFEFDGNNYTISNLSSSLFGTVSGAVIKNVNIIDSRISNSEYMDIGFIVNKALNYSYTADNGSVYTTGETLIQHCSVARSSIITEGFDSEAPTEPQTESVEIVAPDVIEYDEEGNVIEKEAVLTPTKTAEYCIGAITGIGGKIKDCYVTEFEISCNLDDYWLYVGGISGKPESVTDSAVYNFRTSGNIFNSGGIVGSASGTRLYDTLGNALPTACGGNIQGCVARSIELSSEVSCGGIAGEATSNNKNATISNCYAKNLYFLCGVFDTDNTALELGSTGSLIGSDGNETYGHTITNTVVSADYDAIGKKIRSRYDETTKLAPDYAFYQENILSILNTNSVEKDNPKEIYTGNFKITELFGDESGDLAYPTTIEDLFEIIRIKEE